MNKQNRSSERSFFGVARRGTDALRKALIARARETQGESEARHFEQAFERAFWREPQT